MKILYLYSEVMGYTLSTIRSLVGLGVDVHVVAWDERRLTPFRFGADAGCVAYSRSSLSRTTLNALVDKIDPDVTVVSGWMDELYLAAAFRLRRAGRIVVTGLDNRWCGSLRQRLAGVAGHFRVADLFFSHAWVAGAQQYEFARRLGFAPSRVIFDLYSADLSLFAPLYTDAEADKAASYPHRFLFVGRFEPVKGLYTLLAAWDRIGDFRGDWDLHLIGNGSLKTKLTDVPHVVVRDFIQPELLAGEIIKAGCAVLPSVDDPWGVVVHEFASAGLPLVVSDAVGSATSFLIRGFNGFSFRAGCVDELAFALRRIIGKTDAELCEMSKASRSLSARITPDTSARNLMSLVDR